MRRVHTYWIAALLAVSFLGIASRSFSQEADPLTGRLRMSIPVGMLQANDISVPISIFHHGGSIRVAEGEGSCGLGWNLAVGGAVHSVVKGLPDHINTASSKGWLHRPNSGVITPLADDDLSNYDANEQQDYNNLQTLHNNYMYDTEPDIYSVSAPGLAFQFVFEQNGTPRLLRHADVVMEFLPNALAPITINVKTKTGLVYTFGGDATQPQTRDWVDVRSPTYGNPWTINTAVRYIPVPIFPGVAYINNWKLTAITSTSSGTTAAFHYKPNLSTSADGASRAYYGLDSMNHVTNLFKYYPLDYITLKSLKASFSWNKGLLQSAMIEDLTSGDKTKVELIYATGITETGSHKLVTKKFLSKITRIGSDCARGEAHSFEYYGIQSIQTPPATTFTIPTVSWRLNWYQDFYGFFNNIVPNRNFPTLYFAAGENDGRRLRVHQISGISSTTISGENRSVSGTALSFGALKKVIFPSGGYAEMTYEPNFYRDVSVSPAQTYAGPDTRVKKITLQGGQPAYGGTIESINVDRAVEKEYQYVETDGTTSSGKILSPVKLGFIAMNGANRVPTNLGETPEVNYSRVVERITGKGYTVYEFSIPGVFPETTNGEWKATKSRIARSSNFAVPNLKHGYYLFPYPPSTNYDHKRGQPTRVATYSELNVMLSEKTISYQSVTVNPVTVKGVQFEKIGNIYYYGVYEILTGRLERVLQEVVKQAGLEDPTKLLQTTINYGYNSGHLPSTVTTILPNSTSTIKTFKYARDFPFTSPTGDDAIAIKLLNDTNRGALPVEEYTTMTIPGSASTTVDASLLLYRDFGGGQVLPRYFKTLPSGAAHTPASMNVQSFSYSTAYRTSREVLAYEEGRPLTEQDENKNIGSTHYLTGIGLPAANFQNVYADQSVFDSFEGTHSYGLLAYGPTIEYDSVWTGVRSMKFTSNTQSLRSSLTKPVQKNGNLYRMSCWAKGASGRSITMKILKAADSSVLVSTSFAISASNQWKYFEAQLDVGANPTNPGPFRLEVVTNATASSKVYLDDVLLTPKHARFSAQTVLPLKGVTSSTDDRGFSTKITYDHVGRPVATLDRNRNLVNKKEYSVKNSVGPTVSAFLTMYPYQATKGEEVIFTPMVNGMTNCDPNLTYLWEIDGVPQTPGSGGVLNYTFQTEGLHTIKLTANSNLYGSYYDTKTLCVNARETLTIQSAITDSSGQPASNTLSCLTGPRNINLQLPGVNPACSFTFSWTKNGNAVGSGSVLTIYPISIPIQGGSSIEETYNLLVTLDCSGLSDCVFGSGVLSSSYQATFTVVHIPADCP